jgi:autotransporter-associated beta strand protein
MKPSSFRRSRIFLALNAAFAALALSPSMRGAEEINYPGTSLNPETQLQNYCAGYGNSLCPNDESNNKVTVDYVPGAGVADPNYVYGGVSNVANQTVTGNQVFIVNGSLGHRVYGGHARTEAASNTVTVSGGSVGWNVYGGYARAKTTNNTVTISGGSVGASVSGGYTDGHLGVATNNTATISGGSVGANVYGGYIDGNFGVAANNTATISGGSVNSLAFGGYAHSNSGDATTTSNTLTINGSDVKGNAYGGYTDSNGANTVATANNNALALEGGHINGFAYGGYADSETGEATAAHNNVTLSDGSLDNDVTGGKVFGGYAHSALTAAAADNTVTLSGASVDGSYYGTDIQGGDIYGGHAEGDSGATANNNTIAISDGNVERLIYGGYADSASGGGAANNNTITISGGKVGLGAFSTAYGGYVTGYADTTANGNTFIVSGGNMNGNAISGSAYSNVGDTTATGNTFIVSAGEVNGVAYSGIAYSDGTYSDGAAKATNNTFIVSGGRVVRGVYGGEASSGSGAADATHNTVTISGGGVADDHGGMIYGGTAYSGTGVATAADNTITISGGAVGTDGGGYIYGGYAVGRDNYNASNTSATIASRNTIIVSGDVKVNGNGNGNYGWIGGLHGGRTDGNANNHIANDNTVVVSGGASVGGNVYGGMAIGDEFGSATASGNTIAISDASVSGRVVGGMAISSKLYPATASGNSATASGNRVTIRDAKVGGSVYGGDATNYYDNSATITTTHNTVTLLGALTFDAATELYGGNAISNANPDAFTGNTLNLKTTGPLSVAGLYNFQFLNFTLPGNSAANAPMLTVGELNYGGAGVVLDIRTPGAFSLGNNSFDGDYILLRNSGKAQNLADISEYSLHDTPFVGGALTLNRVNSSRVRGEFEIRVGGADDKDLILTIANYQAPNATLTWKGSADNHWTNYGADASKSPANWEGKVDFGDGAEDVAQYLDGDSVLFDDTGAAQNSVTINANGVAPAAVTVNNASGHDYAFTGGPITGAGALTKAGDGVLTLLDANAYTGGTTITGGLIAFGRADNFGSGDITLNGGGLQWASGNTLDISGQLDAIGANGGVFNTNGNNVTLANALTGEGGVTKTGAGVLTLTGDGAYTGGTTITDGALQIGDGGASAGSVVGDIVNHAALIFNRSDDITYGGKISGSGALEKKGDGVLTLTGDSTYTGVTTLNSGVLQIGDGGASNGNIAGDIVNHAALIFNRSNNITYGGKISGDGALEKKGDGVLTLTGDSANTGGATVTAGVLNLTGALASGVTVKSGATLALRGAVNNGGGVTLANGAILGAYQGSVIDGDLAADAATLNFYLPQGIDDGQTILNVGGNVTLSGDNTVGLYMDGAHTNLPNLTTAGEVIKLIDAAGGLTNSGAISATAHIGATLTYQYDFNIAANTADGELQATLGAVTSPANPNPSNPDPNPNPNPTPTPDPTPPRGNEALTWNTGSGNWNHAEENWRGMVEGATVTQYREGDNVIFNTPGAAATITVAQGGVKPKAVRVDNASGKDYAFVGGPVTGATLTKRGAGALILAGDHAYAGGATIHAGTLQIGNGGAGGSLAGNIVNNAALIFNRSNSLTHSNAISGAGDLTQKGGGAVTLSGANTYTGATHITSGSALTVTGSLGGGNYAGAIANAGTLTFNQNANQTLSGAIHGAGALVKGGAGALTLAGDNAYSGATTVNAGTLNLTGALAGSAVTVNKTAAFTLRGKAGKDVNVASGATLNVYQGGAIGGKLGAAGAFLNFYLPSGFAAGGTLLNVAGNADITGSTVNVGVLGSSSPLKAGDAVTLFSALTLTGAPANNATNNGAANNNGGLPSAKLLFGATLVYDFDLRAEGNALLATVRDGAVTPPVTPPIEPPVTPPVGKVDARTKALSEGFLAGTALLNLGADFLVDRGLAAALKNGERNKGLGFAAIGGSRLEHETGSSIDVDGYSLIAGLAATRPLPAGAATVGAFIEHGEGDYDTFNRFANAADVHGKGKTNYTGAGLLARLKFAETERGHLYAETSTRMGKVDVDFAARNWRDPLFGRSVAYAADSRYASAHAGLGYVWNMNDRARLKLYGQYLWSRQGSDTVKLSSGESVRFADVDSQRLRLGARWSHAISQNGQAYLGAAWEHEFDGKARATLRVGQGYRLATPDLEGDTGIIEAGFALAPNANQPLTLDIGLQGYAGQREGVTGSVKVNYRF